MTLAASWLPSHNVSRSSGNPVMARQRLPGPSCTLPRRVCRLLWAPQAPEHFLAVASHQTRCDSRCGGYRTSASQPRDVYSSSSGKTASARRAGGTLPPMKGTAAQAAQATAATTTIHLHSGS